MNLRHWLLCLAAAVAPAGCTMGQTFDVKTATLKNGMKVLVQEDHTIPNVAMYTFYRIGSRNERPGTTGISHFFDHMMFNGAKKYGPGEFDRTMEAAGGANNAYTNRDTTVYQDWFPRSALALIFDLEADRIENLSFDPKVISSERGVVASERRTSVDANNFGILKNYIQGQFPPTLETASQLAGVLADLEFYGLDEHEINDLYAKINAMTLADAQRVIQQYYPTDNLVFVLVGKSSEIRDAVKKYAPTMDTREISDPGFGNAP